MATARKTVYRAREDTSPTFATAGHLDGVVFPDPVSETDEVKDGPNSYRDE